jgi:hypothetical protein
MSDRTRGSASDPDDVPLPPIATTPRRGPAAASPAYTRRPAPDTSPWALIGVGAFLCVLGTALLQVDDALFVIAGAVLLGLGSIVVSIGTIAEGIRLGARWVDFDRGH